MMNRMLVQNEWKWVKLGDACDIVMGQSPPSTSYNTEGIGLPFFQGKAEFTDTHPAVVKWCTAPGKIAEPNDVLLSVRAPVGATNIADKKCCIGRGLAAIRFTNHKYLFYFLKSIERELDKKGTGTTFRAISGETIRHTLFPLPSDTTQQAIVSKIEELFSELDKGIEQLKTAQQQLKVYRQAVLKYAFEGRFCESPRFTVKELSQLTEVKDGTHDTPKYVDAGIPFITQKNIKESGLSFEDVKYISQSDHEAFYRRSNVAHGDILISMIGANRGMSCLVNDRRVFSIKNVGLIKLNTESINNLYLSYFLKSPLAKNYIMSLSKGGAQEFVGLKELRNFPIAYFGKSDQLRIVEEIESRLSVSDKLEETINNSLLQAESLRQSILKKAFEGKLLSQAELESIQELTKSIAPPELRIAAEQEVTYQKKKQAVPFPKKIEGIKNTDLHAGILAMVIDAHEKSPEHHMKLSHVKGEKIAHLVEAHIGIDLGRNPRKDAAGPDDFPHLKKVESRALKAGWFNVKKLRVGQTYISKRGMTKIIQKVKETLPPNELQQIEKLIRTFLPFELEHAEVIATLYAAWNNLLLEQKNPTDEEIVFEARENWSKRKLGIEREIFFKALKWMKEHGYEAEGKGKKVK